MLPVSNFEVTLNAHSALCKRSQWGQDIDSLQ